MKEKKRTRRKKVVKKVTLRDNTHRQQSFTVCIKTVETAQCYLHTPETATFFKGLCNLCGGTELHP